MVNYLTLKQIQSKYQIPVAKARKVINNNPNYLEGLIRQPIGRYVGNHYLVPETEVFRLYFLQNKKK